MRLLESKSLRECVLRTNSLELLCVASRWIFVYLQDQPRSRETGFLEHLLTNFFAIVIFHGIRQVARAPSRLLLVGECALEAAVRLLGNGEAEQCLCVNFQIRFSGARCFFGLVVPVTIEDGFR